MDTKIVTEIKTIIQIHQEAQDHQLEAFDHLLADIGISQRRKNGKIAEKIITLQIDQVHVTDRHDTKTNEDTVEAKVKTACRTKIKDLQAKTRIKIGGHIKEIIQVGVTRGGLSKL